MEDYKLDLELDEKNSQDNILDLVRNGQIDSLEQYIDAKVDSIPDSVAVLLSKATYPDTNILFSVQLSWMYDFYTARQKFKINN